MKKPDELDPIERSVKVPLMPARAFALFVDELGAWWPKEYTWSGDVLEAIGIEPYVGGHCYEIGPADFRCDWGTVLVFERSLRLVFTWQINADRTPQPDPERASKVEVHFDSHGGSNAICRVSLQHRGFERCGEDGADYRAGLNSPEGWTYILASFAAFCV